MEGHEVIQVAREQKETRPALVAAGSVLGSLAAFSCCLLPLALFGLGATGAWIGTLSALTSYQPIFVVITIGFLVGGFWMVYRKPRANSADGSYCARPVSPRIVKGALWSATVLVVAAAAFPYVAPLMLDG
ncbi:MAG: mercuric transporter MerT family protein [Gammaproteobacteria bacterium]